MNLSVSGLEWQNYTTITLSVWQGIKLHPPTLGQGHTGGGGAGGAGGGGGGGKERCLY